MKDLVKLNLDQLMQEFFAANSTYFAAMNGFVFTTPKTHEYLAAKKYLDEVVEEIAKRKK